jgi:hypothetical protein
MKYLLPLHIHEALVSINFSEDQNRALKSIYKVVRDVVFDFLDQLPPKIGRKNNDITLFLLDSYKKHDYVVEVDTFGLIIDFDRIDPFIRKIFPNIKELFVISIYIDPKDAPASMQRITFNDTQKSMAWGILINLFYDKTKDEMRVVLQHEVQHILNTEFYDVTDYEANSIGYLYLVHPTEIDSFAKNTAYYYFKFGSSEFIDLKDIGILLKLSKEIKALKPSFLYYFFAKYPERAKMVDPNISDENIEKLHEAGLDFLDRIKYYLPFYDKKLQQLKN